MTAITVRDRTALITGASSGIGEAFAEVFASAGFNVVVTARRNALLQALADRLAGEYGVAAHAIPCDLSSPGGAANLVEDLARRGIAIDALVNSAGFGLSGTYAKSAWPSHAAMLDVQVGAVAELTNRLLSGMLDRRYGRIVNVASLAGLVPSGAGAMYGASKAFVVRLSQELDREVRADGVHVTVVCPGLTRTHFHDAPEIQRTVQRMPAWAWMDPSTVARQGFDAVMAGRTVCVTGWQNKALVFALTWIPASIMRTTGRLAMWAASQMARVVRSSPAPRGA